ncbi:MAG: LysM peptidoglycan-binding domain-containing protein, partial [Christensenellales bacterium]
NKNFLYKVKDGDTLKSISNKFKILERKLIEDNCLACEELMKGDVLYISCENAHIYVVKPLDNLNKIAKKYNVTSEYLIEKNALKTNVLFIGQKLVI